MKVSCGTQLLLTSTSCGLRGGTGRPSPLLFLSLALLLLVDWAVAQQPIVPDLHLGPAPLVSPSAEVLRLLEDIAVAQRRQAAAYRLFEWRNRALAGAATLAVLELAAMGLGRYRQPSLGKPQDV
ncbi:MAG: hypothetical protein HY335_06010 [Deinococcus sp.]|nr:hypothetical protein [Deinococcus sp.]